MRYRELFAETEHKNRGNRTQDPEETNQKLQKIENNSNNKRENKMDYKTEIMKRSKASKGRQQRKIELNGSCA